MTTQNLKLVQDGIPSWCHSHGRKMATVAVGLCGDYLVLQGSAAEVVIRKKSEHWEVSWCILHSGLEETKGRRLFSDEDLEQAFGLSDEVPEWGKETIEEYGGTTAKAGQFIRYKNWLNIPCPGTSHDGDPNVSVRLDEKITTAVKSLLHQSR